MAAEIRGVVAALCSGAIGAPPKTGDSIRLARGIGAIGGDAVPSSHRQLMITAESSGSPGYAPGAAGESFVVRGFDLARLTEGRRLRVGDAAVIQVTEVRASSIESPGAIYARVLRDGVLATGDAVRTDPAFDSPRFAVLTLSDRAAAGARQDESGALAVTLLESMLGHGLIAREVLPDDIDRIAARLRALADESVCDLIVTTGGTGLSPRDATPEATQSVIDRQVPGIAEAIRAAGLAKTPHAMLSRAVCGQRGATLIVNLSGSPKAVREQLEVLRPVLGHVLTTTSGVPQDCGNPASSVRPES